MTTATAREGHYIIIGVLQETIAEVVNRLLIIHPKENKSVPILVILQKKKQVNISCFQLDKCEKLSLFCFYFLFYIIINGIFLVFGQLVGQYNHMKLPTLALGNCNGDFSLFSILYWLTVSNWL